jgi:UDP-glucose 6-dehydrogenase
MVGDLATKIGANPDKVLNAVGSDSRINNKFFRYGFGWGGPCFPRDTRAYIRLAKNNDMPFNMCEASTKINDRHLDFQIEQFLSSGQTEYITDSITYKKGTVILEESQQLKFAYKLALSGIKVTIEESQEVIQNLKNIYGELFTYVERK